MKNETECLPASSVLLELAEMRMPFGKYKNRLLIDLPEPYVVWLANKGFPGGRLGDMLRMTYEIKVNGLEHLFKPLKTFNENKTETIPNSLMTKNQTRKKSL